MKFSTKNLHKKVIKRIKTIGFAGLTASTTVLGYAAVSQIWWLFCVFIFILFFSIFIPACFTEDENAKI